MWIPSAIAALLGTSAALQSYTLVWACAILALIVACRARKPTLRLGALFMLCMQAYTFVVIHQYRYPEPFQVQDNQVVQLSGVVVSLTQMSPYGQQFDFREASTGRRLRIYAASDLSISAGQRGILTGRLRQPVAFTNLHEDGRYYWIHQGIQATLQLQTWSPVSQGWHWQQWRQAFYDKRAQPTQRHWPLMRALVFGQKADVDSVLFQHTGTSHLMAISGLHIGLIGCVGYFFGRFIWRCVPGLYRSIRADQSAALMALLFAFIYALLAGLSIPTQRALLMMVLVLFTRWLGLRGGMATGLSCALIGVLICTPLAVLFPSFWLSFGAVALLAWLGHQRGKINLQWGISLGLMPLGIYFFQGFSWVSPLTNLIAIPWMSFLILPPLLLGLLILPALPVLGHGLLDWVTLQFDGLLGLLSLFEQVSPFWVMQAPLWACILGGVGLLWCLSRVAPYRYLGLILCLPMCFSPVHQPSQGEFTLDVFDVGQGNAQYIQTKHHGLLFDTGTQKATRRVLIPALRGRALDGIVVSHFDVDHSGGLSTLIESYAPQYIWTSQTAYWPTAEPCHAGVRWVWDGVTFEFLHPQNIVRAPIKHNNHSCVLRVANAYHQVLLTGDIERGAEQTIISNPNIQSDVLVVPHHGSQSSSTQRFIEAVQPNRCVISSGRYNPYHHPHPKVVARYHALGHQCHQTAVHGGIQYRVGRVIESLVVPTKPLVNLWYNAQS